MKKTSTNKAIRYLLLAFLVGAIAYFIDLKNHYSTQKLAEIAEYNLQKKEVIAEKKLAELLHSIKNNPPKKINLLESDISTELYKTEEIGLYAYKNDTLIYWSDNEPAIDLINLKIKSFSEIIKLRNGWYECLTINKKKSDNIAVFALIKLKTEYEFENKYLKNEFSKWLNLPINTDIVIPANIAEHSISSKYGHALFEIKRNETYYKDLDTNLISSALFLLCFLFLFISIYNASKQFIKNKWFQSVFIFMSVLFIRTGMVYFKIPSCFYLTNFYNATIFANADSFYFSLLGDVMLNSILLLFFSFYLLTSKINLTHITFSKKLKIVIVYLILIFMYAMLVPSLIHSLITNSHITFNINRIFDFNYFSLIGIISISITLLGFYFALEKLIILCVKSFNIRKQHLFIYGSSLILIIFLLNILKADVFFYLWFMPLAITSYLLNQFKISANFMNTGLKILIVAFCMSVFFNKYEESNKRNTFMALSYILTDRQDAIAENEFTKIIQNLKKDSKLKNLISLLPLSSQQIEQSIKQINFSGYFERYDVVLSLFKQTQPVFQFNEPKYTTINYFENQIEHSSQPTICENLYFIDKKNKPIRYIGKLNLSNYDFYKDSSYCLYFQLDPKLINNIGVFPDLLLNKTLENRVENKHISYAVYDNNKLQMSFGNYTYPAYYFKNKNIDNRNGVQHYIYPKHNNTTIIISDKKISFYNYFTSSSYIFVFFSLLIMFGTWLYALFKKGNYNFQTLNNRIQFIFISIIALSLTAVTLGTIWVVSSQSEIKNVNELLQKSQTILNELKQNVGQQNELDQSYKEYFNFTLKKLSQVTSSDVSLFDKNGILFSTSQPAIYDQGLVSKYMNPNAYSVLLGNETSNFSHREAIGNLNYVSTYIPFYNIEDKLLGYLNLPYFARQKDLEKELSAYLTTLLNIYTILFVITTLFALLVSNLLTKPLRIIKQQISNTKFVKHFNPIKWESKDEIGSLVTEYNAMIIELKKNSELLAQSEKEKAWREMSKQIAHEIKNPLTPMKLNIQHLQRVVKTNPENISEKVDSVANVLIQQIDILSNIATEFSNFGNFPETKLERIDLNEILQKETQLFKISSDCKIELYTEPNLFVMIDKEQFSRVIINLIKNAEQAIPKHRTGVIRLSAYRKEQIIDITLEDNGVGIAKEFYSTIFLPNFTTKNSGTGLGLAMVKNSIQNFNGHITFESELEKGTTFKITLPAF
jgi:signal transduction histidine kinase